MLALIDSIFRQDAKIVRLKSFFLTKKKMSIIPSDKYDYLFSLMIKDSYATWSARVSCLSRHIIANRQAGRSQVRDCCFQRPGSNTRSLRRAAEPSDQYGARDHIAPIWMSPSQARNTKLYLPSSYWAETEGPHGCSGYKYFVQGLPTQIICGPGYGMVLEVSGKGRPGRD